MISEEAIRLAHECAQRLNIPWSFDRVNARRRRLWPFPAVWTVESITEMDGVNAIAIFRLREGTAQAKPVRLRYTKH